MSLWSVTAYLSPTMALNFPISSGESGGTDGWTMFIDLSCSSFPPSGCAAQPVVDGLAQSVHRNGHHRDGCRACCIGLAKIAKKMGCGFSRIATFRQIQHGRRTVLSCNRRMAERQQRLPGLDALRVEPDAGARGVMRGQHARRQGLAVIAFGL